MIAFIHTKDGSMETALGVSGLLKSPIAIYRLIWEQGAQYVESPHKKTAQGKAQGSFIESYTLSFSTDGTSWTTYKEGNVEKVLNMMDTF